MGDNSKQASRGLRDARMLEEGRPYVLLLKKVTAWSRAILGQQRCDSFPCNCLHHRRNETCTGLRKMCAHMHTLLYAMLLRPMICFLDCSGDS